MMWLKKLPGIVVILIGIGLLGYWADRTFLHPTHADRQFWANVADHGGTAAVNGKPPAATFLMLGIFTMLGGSHMMRK